MGAVGGVIAFSAFELDDDGIVDKEIDTVGGDEFDAVVFDVHRDFTLDVKAAFFQFVDEAYLIDVFEESGAEGGVDFEGGIDNLTADVVEEFGDRYLHVFLGLGALVTLCLGVFG